MRTGCLLPGGFACPGADRHFSAPPVADGATLRQVRSDCPPPRLLAFLVGEAGAAANEAAEAVAMSKAEEEALLEQACPPPLPSYMLT